MAAPRPASLHAVLLVVALCLTTVYAFVPAFPSNITLSLSTGAAAILQVNWAPQSFFKTDAQIVLRRGEGSGADHGALVHFNDSVAASVTTSTSTPWVAFVSCDANITDTAASEDNIFTRAEKLGAVAAVLYSLYSQTCYIHQSLEDPSQFDRGLDIFTLSSLSTSLLVNSTFANIDAAQFGTFDAARLDAAHDQVITPNGPTGSPFLIANTIVVGTSGSTDVPGASGTVLGGPTASSSTGASASVTDTNAASATSSGSSAAPNSAVQPSVQSLSFVCAMLCVLFAAVWF
ncbi:hypothetical protein C2E23DRAFT_884612 [Lenzites betulinus]|nr:hypothetical protein C2E23DRAFT_884612 [Lenzites betulinus]